MGWLCVARTLRCQALAKFEGQQGKMSRVVVAMGLNSIGLFRPFADSLTPLQVECVEVPWGCGADEAKLEQILKADTDKKIKAVAVVHNETTTGVTSDIKQVREVPPVSSMQ